MKRDMDLVREVLLKLEVDADLNGDLCRVTTNTLGIDGRSDNDIAYHLLLVIEAGFVDGYREQSGDFAIRKLTWEGHEFLDDVRDPEIWRKTKERAHAVVSVGLGFLWEIARAEIKTKLGLA
jgi:hypothetical protein